MFGIELCRRRPEVCSAKNCDQPMPLEFEKWFGQVAVMLASLPVPRGWEMHGRANKQAEASSWLIRQLIDDKSVVAGEFIPDRNGPLPETECGMRYKLWKEVGKIIRPRVNLYLVRG